MSRTFSPKLQPFIYFIGFYIHSITTLEFYTNVIITSIIIGTSAFTLLIDIFIIILNLKNERYIDKINRISKYINKIQNDIQMYFIVKIYNNQIVDIEYASTKLKNTQKNMKWYLDVKPNDNTYYKIIDGLENKDSIINLYKSMSNTN